MRLKLLAATSGLVMLGGCADLTTGLTMLNDQMMMDQGGYWEDYHQSDDFDNGDGCRGIVDQGVVNNQSYARVRNRTNREMTATINWNTGSVSSFSLSPGETSNFVYMSPSMSVSGINFQCY